MEKRLERCIGKMQVWGSTATLSLIDSPLPPTPNNHVGYKAVSLSNS